jgi:hypothetical protein
VSGAVSVAGRIAKRRKPFKGYLRHEVLRQATGLRWPQPDCAQLLDEHPGLVDTRAADTPASAGLGDPDSGEAALSKRSSAAFTMIWSPFTGGGRCMTQLG